MKLTAVYLDGGMVQAFLSQLFDPTWLHVWVKHIETPSGRSPNDD